MFMSFDESYRILNTSVRIFDSCEICKKSSFTNLIKSSFYSFSTKAIRNYEIINKMPCNFSILFITNEPDELSNLARFLAHKMS